MSTKKEFKELPMPNHPEEYSLEECAAFQPWKVDLRLTLTKDDPQEFIFNTCVRASNPNDAGVVAHRMFEEVKLNVFGLDEWSNDGAPFPKDAEVIKLTEDQYKELHKEYKSYKMYREYGMLRNPSIFFYLSPSFVQHMEVLTNKFKSSSIIVPDKSQIDMVHKSRNRK